MTRQFLEAQGPFFEKKLDLYAHGVCLPNSGPYSFSFGQGLGPKHLIYNLQYVDLLTEFLCIGCLQDEFNENDKNVGLP